MSWVKKLDDQDILLLEELIDSDFNFKSCSEKTGKSYFLLKNKISDLKEKVSKYKEKSDFKEYLDFLVYEDAVISSIAEVLYKKHLQELEGK